MPRVRLQVGASCASHPLPVLPDGRQHTHRRVHPPQRPELRKLHVSVCARGGGGGHKHLPSPANANATPAGGCGGVPMGPRAGRGHPNADVQSNSKQTGTNRHAGGPTPTVRSHVFWKYARTSAVDARRRLLCGEAGGGGWGCQHRRKKNNLQRGGHVELPTPPPAHAAPTRACHTAHVPGDATVEGEVLEQKAGWVGPGVLIGPAQTPHANAGRRRNNLGPIVGRQGTVRATNQHHPPGRG